MSKAKKKKKKTVKATIAVDDQATGALRKIGDALGKLVTIRYIGKGPFKLDDADKPLMTGDKIDGSHPYAKHRASLLLRTDFEELKDGGN